MAGSCVGANAIGRLFGFARALVCCTVLVEIIGVVLLRYACAFEGGVRRGAEWASSPTRPLVWALMGTAAAAVLAIASANPAWADRFVPSASLIDWLGLYSSGCMYGLSADAAMTQLHVHAHVRAVRCGADGGDARSRKCAGGGWWWCCC